MSSVVKIDDHTFICNDHDISLLEAIEKENITVDYQCRQGFCGMCRLKLVEGHVKYFEEPIAFIPDHCILPCCCRSDSDLIIEKE